MQSRNQADYRLLAESYDKVITNEGFLDTLKAKGAGVVGAVKGAGQQIGGAFKGAVAGVKGDVAGVNAAKLQRQEGATQGKLAKIESYRKTAGSKIQKLNDEIFNDLLNLGIDIKKVSPQTVNAFKIALDKSFQELVDSVKGTPVATAPAAKAAPATQAVTKATPKAQQAPVATP